MFSVSILEAKTIIRTVSRTYGTDLSGIAMSSFRMRLSEILQSNAIPGTDILVARLLEDSGYYEKFIYDISIGSPDMFRDPDFWIHFREQIFSLVLKPGEYPEIIVPECVTGNELYSVAILLRETGLDYHVDLIATCRNEKIMRQIQGGGLPGMRFKNSKDNYDVFNPGSDFEQFTENRNGNWYLKPDLIQDVEFRVKEPEQKVCSEKTAMVLYRNRMLYQNTEHQYKTLVKFFEEMNEGTWFITGIQESIEGFGLDKYYRELSPDYKIYIKRDVN